MLIYEWFCGASSDLIQGFIGVITMGFDRVLMIKHAGFYKGSSESSKEGNRRVQMHLTLGENLGFCLSIS